MYIIGINAYHPDSSAALIKDGKVIAACEEERFTRIKHDSAFPIHSIKYCLKEAKITFKDIHAVAIARNPRANIFRKSIYALTNITKRTKRKEIIYASKKALNTLRFKKTLQDNINRKIPVQNIFFIEHHLSHLSSVYFCSGFKEASLVSLDNSGDFVSTALGVGRQNEIKIIKKIFYPHSLGALYSTFTYFLGFPYYGDEYKVMALASYGKPIYENKIWELIKFKKDYVYRIHPEFIIYGGMDFSAHIRPKYKINIPNKLIEKFGPPRIPESKITQYHKDIAASLQRVLEKAVFYILNKLYEKTKNKNLCIGGGIALNSVLNGKIAKNTPFRNIFTHAAANDGGNSLGAALYLYYRISKSKDTSAIENTFWGPKYSSEEIKDILDKENLIYTTIDNEDILIEKAANYIKKGLIIGWFQGRMEFGTRALGNRSILASTTSSEIKDIINLKVKGRESFRPFAGAILEEDLKEFYETNNISPFMCFVYPIKKEKQNKISAVMHIDSSGRVQSVNKKNNPLLYKLLLKVKELTGIPVVLNTSFNKNEPIVCHPQEAIECFKKTCIDVLIIDKFIVEK